MFRIVSISNLIDHNIKLKTSIFSLYVLNKFCTLCVSENNFNIITRFYNFYKFSVVTRLAREGPRRMQIYGSQYMGPDYFKLKVQFTKPSF